MIRYRVVLADPPWPFRDMGSRMAPSHNGTGREYAHYSVQTLDEICETGMHMLTQRVSEDAFLFLWAPNSLVLDGSAQKVCEGWGFKPKQLITWVKTSKNGKPRLGGGHYTRVCTEQMILARRGKAKVRDRSVPGVIHAERTRHSAKPDESYELIERLCEGPYLELYARRQYPNWSAWGDQLEAA